MHWYAVVVGLLLSVSPACSTSSTPQGPHHEISRSAVIVVGGYYGTRLSRVDNGDLLWLTVSQVFGGERSLVLPLPDLGFDGVALRPSGIMDEIRIVPWLYSFNVYRPLLDELEGVDDGHVTIYPLNYDWRLDLMDAVRLLSDEIHRLKSAGVVHIALVAHSMGGLIVSYYLRYGDQELERAVETWEGAGQVEKVVMAGVPFQGSMWSFRNMQYGRLIGFNSTLLDREAMASFPASYFTLPLLEADVLLTTALKKVRGMIRSPSDWRAQGWGLLKKTEGAPPRIVERRDLYTAYWLHRSQRFYDLLHAPLGTPGHRPIPLLYLYGADQPTLAMGVWMQDETGLNEANVVFEREQIRKHLPGLDPSILYDDGDGTVTVGSAALPEAYEKSLQVTTGRLKMGHAEIVTSREGRRQIAGFLQGQAKEIP